MKSKSMPLRQYHFGLHFVNWHREVSVRIERAKSGGSGTSPLRNSTIPLIVMYSLISMLLAQPSGCRRRSAIMKTRAATCKRLEKIGVSTPALISISDIDLVEEYIEGGDLYIALASDQPARLAFGAGCLTARMHRAGYAFVDNKAQNYLVRGDSVMRTDLGFIKKNNSHMQELALARSCKHHGLGNIGKLKRRFLMGTCQSPIESFPTFR